MNQAASSEPDTPDPQPPARDVADPEAVLARCRAIAAAQKQRAGGGPGSSGRTAKLSAELSGDDWLDQAGHHFDEAGTCLERAIHRMGQTDPRRAIVEELADDAAKIQQMLATTRSLRFGGGEA